MINIPIFPIFIDANWYVSSVLLNMRSFYRKLQFLFSNGVYVVSYIIQNFNEISNIVYSSLVFLSDFVDSLRRCFEPNEVGSRLELCCSNC